jgi:adenylyltransferase/sulfurtransferase
MRLSQIGEAGQKKIESLRILVLGCGALGSAGAETLARMGVGFLRLVDRDSVEFSNLPRQHLFKEADAEFKFPKVIAAAKALSEINSRVKTETHILNVDAGNIEPLLENIDAVIDGFDRVEMRYLLNDICVKKNIPWFYAGIRAARAAIMPVIPQGPCFRCVFPDVPAKNSLPTCEDIGVLGAAVATASAFQVTSLIRYFLEHPAKTFLINADLWTQDISKIQVEKEKDCPCCGKHRFEFLDEKKTSGHVE